MSSSRYLDYDSIRHNRYAHRIPETPSLLSQYNVGSLKEQMEYFERTALVIELNVNFVQLCAYDSLP